MKNSILILLILIGCVTCCFSQNNSKISLLEIYAIKGGHYQFPISREEVEQTGLYVKVRNEDDIRISNIETYLTDLKENIYIENIIDSEYLIDLADIDTRIILKVHYSNTTIEYYHFTSVLWWGIIKNDTFYIPTYELYQAIYSFLPKGYSLYENENQLDFEDTINKNLKVN